MADSDQTDLSDADIDAIADRVVERMLELNVSQMTGEIWSPEDDDGEVHPSLEAREERLEAEVEGEYTEPSLDDEYDVPPVNDVINTTDE